MTNNQLTSARIRKIFQRLQQQKVSPQTELKFNSHFELLIAVMLSAQATDISVNKVTPALFSVANDAKKMLALGLEQLEHYIKSIGLYRTKAKNILATCQLLIDRHHGKVPDDRQALEALPGVGRKTANVVLNIAFDQPTIAVDTHIFRLANRTGIAPGKNVLAVEKGLLANVPKKFLNHAHHWLILHGRYTCKARQPLCQQCLIADLCSYQDKTEAHNQG